MTNKYAEALKAIGIGGLAGGGLSFLLALATGASADSASSIAVLGILTWLSALGLGAGTTGIFLWLHAASVATGQEEIVRALRERPPAPAPQPATWPPAPARTEPAVLESTPDAEVAATEAHAAPDWTTAASALAELDGRGVPASVAADPRLAVEEILWRLGRGGVSLPKELAGQLNALDPRVLTILARARVAP